MLLRNVHIVGGNGSSNIHIDKGLIAGVGANISAGDTAAIDLDGCMAFPGLINSHDHIDFNLFPKLTGRTYPNYIAWAKDIAKFKKQSIDPVLKIPEALRAQWGLYKNLLAGITTVVNHGKQLDILTDLIDLKQDCISLHSVEFEKNWRLKLNRLGKSGHTFVMHIGEGTDKRSHKEIGHVHKANLFGRRIVAVHGVAMNSEQAQHFKALVWCPSTNLNLLGKTANVDELKKNIPILFGTDSTLTACWNIWEQLRVARELRLLSDEELYNSLTAAPAETWGINGGVIAGGRNADIVIAKTNKQANSLEAFFSVRPEDIMLVLRSGSIRLFDESLKQQLQVAAILPGNFNSCAVEGAVKYVYGDLPALMRSIKKHAAETNFPVSGIQPYAMG